jgi:hypothetical protein
VEISHRQVRPAGAPIPPLSLLSLSAAASHCTGGSLRVRQKRESNARFVRWSNGTVQLFLGGNEEVLLFPATCALAMRSALTRVISCVCVCVCAASTLRCWTWTCRTSPRRTFTSLPSRRARSRPTAVWTTSSSSHPPRSTPSLIRVCLALLVLCCCSLAVRI